MPVELSEIAAGLPAAASFAIASGISAVRDGRRRTTLNAAVHEVRRPLQTLSLAAPKDLDAAGPVESSLRMAALALEQLDREINGRAPAGGSQVVRIAPVVEAAIGRWREPASRAGKSVSLRWQAGEPALVGSELGLAQALDNLITNAIEHGGSRIEVKVTEARGRLRIAVSDSGGGLRPRRRLRLADVAERIGGRRRHGHGLRVVARIAAEHGGGFRLLRDAGTTRAMLELPLGGRRDDG